MARKLQPLPAAGSVPWREYARLRLESRRDQLKKLIKKEERAVEKEIEKDKRNRAFYPQGRLRYWAWVAPYTCIQIVSMAWFFANMIGTNAVIANIPYVPINVDFLLFLLLLAHFVASATFISVDEMVGINLFGRPVLEAPPGFWIVPWGLMTIIWAERNYRDHRFPGPADAIWRTSTDEQMNRPGGDVPDPGYVRPFIVLSGEPVLSNSDRELRKKDEYNPLDEQLPFEVSYSVRFRPSERFGGIFRIARNLSAKGGSITPRIVDLIHEQADRDMQDTLSLLTIATLQDNRQLANEVFMLTLRLHVLRLGIDIDDSGNGIVDVNPSHETNKAQAGIARAALNKRSTITSAEAEERKKTLYGQGDANAVRLGLEALGDGYSHIAKKAKVKGKDALASETLKHALPGKTFVAGLGGIDQVLGLAGAASRFFSKDDEAAAPPAPEPQQEGDTQQ